LEWISLVSNCGGERADPPGRSNRFLKI